MTERVDSAGVVSAFTVVSDSSTDAESPAVAQSGATSVLSWVDATRGNVVTSRVNSAAVPLDGSNPVVLGPGRAVQLATVGANVPIWLDVRAK